ncbi:MAG: hypothetical protein QXK37_00220 [Candidatus Woesearchaeota archaeon]
MNIRHIFVPALDIGEIVPFTIRKTKSIEESIEEQERSRQKLAEFIEKLEQKFGESIFYIGYDEIAGRFYERFMFEQGGFLEIMIEAPLALNAHFISEERAKKFCAALKETLKEMLPDSPVSNMFLDSITVQTQNDNSLTYKKWEIMKEINK